MLSSYIFSVLSFVTFFTGVLAYNKYKNSYLKYFLFFIFYVFLTELFGYYTGFILRKSTFYIYNIYVFFSTIFYLTLFKFYIKNNKFYINLMLIAFILFYFYNILFLQKTLQTSQTYSIILAGIFIVISIIILLIELLNSDKILKINKLLLFWISIGVLLFYSGILPIYVVVDLLNYQGLFDYIILGLNIVMYGCFITGFIVSKKEYNT